MTLKEYKNLTSEQKQALTVEQLNEFKQLEREDYKKHLEETGRIKRSNNDR